MEPYQKGNKGENVDAENRGSDCRSQRKNFAP